MKPRRRPDRQQCPHSGVDRVARCLGAALLGDEKRGCGDVGLSSCSARISRRVNRVTTSEITPPVTAVEAALAAACASTITCAWLASRCVIRSSRARRRVSTMSSASLVFFWRASRSSTLRPRDHNRPGRSRTRTGWFCYRGVRETIRSSSLSIAACSAAMP
jgi:hypothetical protein